MTERYPDVSEVHEKIPDFVFSWTWTAKLDVAVERKWPHFGVLLGEAAKSPSRIVLAPHSDGHGDLAQTSIVFKSKTRANIVFFWLGSSRATFWDLSGPLWGMPGCPETGFSSTDRG